MVKRWGWLAALAAVTLVIAVVVFIDARSAPQAPALTGEQAAIEATTLEGQEVTLLRAATPADGNPIVLYFHALPEDGDDIATSITKRPIVDALLDAGYSIVSSDARGPAWGSDESVDDYRAALEWAEEETGSTRWYALAQSMGGVAATRMLHEDQPSAAAFIAPVVNLSSAATSEVLGASVKESGVNVEKIDPAKGDIFTGVPTVILASPDDEVADFTENAALLAAGVGASATLIETSGKHTDPSNYNAEPILDLFLSATP